MSLICSAFQLNLRLISIGFRFPSSTGSKKSFEGPNDLTEEIRKILQRSEEHAAAAAAASTAEDTEKDATNPAPESAEKQEDDAENVKKSDKI